MGLLDNMEPALKRYPCKVRTILESLDVKDETILRAALLDQQNWSANGLSKALNQRGINVADVSITRHREGSCSC